jgi:uncharacterized protein (TIGR02231 family)
MKNVLFLLLLIYFQSGAESTKSITNTDIKNIEVFQTGAQVNRTVKTSVGAGVTSINIEGLSQSIDKNSIDVKAFGDVMILSVTHQLNYLNGQKKLAEQESLEDSLQSIQERKGKLEDLAGIYKDEVDMLKANKSIGGANTGVSVEQLQKMADYYRNRMMELNNKMEDIEREQKKLADRETKLRKQLNDLSAKKDAPTSTITVNVSAKGSSNVVLDLSYYIPAAGWAPQYDLRAKDVSSPIELAYKANVFQSTGESWDDVKLKLSTGNPSLGGTKPNLTAWSLNFYYPRPRKEYAGSAPAGLNEINIRGSREKSAELYKDDLILRDADKISDEIIVAENQLATSFDIPVPYTIPSDGKKYSVEIQNYSLKAAYSYNAVPKLDNDAFLIGRVTGWEQYNLLPGNANIYFESSYVGKSFINPQLTNDTLDLSFGRDKRIVIKREKIKDLSKTRFIGGTTEKEIHYSITVRNTKKDKINITVEDQLPMSMNTDIIVKPYDYSGAVYNMETGKLTWTFDVNPASSEEKKLSFAVKFPTGRLISGL